MPLNSVEKILGNIINKLRYCWNISWKSKLKSTYKTLRNYITLTKSWRKMLFTKTPKKTHKKLQRSYVFI